MTPPFADMAAALHTARATLTGEPSAQERGDALLAIESVRLQLLILARNAA